MNQGFSCLYTYPEPDYKIDFLKPYNCAENPIKPYKNHFFNILAKVIKSN